MPHGEEGHAGKDDCGSRDTAEEPTAHGSRADPAADRILPNRTSSAVPPRDAACSSRSLRRGKICQEQGLNRYGRGTGWAKDQEAKESAKTKDPAEAGGVFTDYGELNDPARQGHTAGKHSEVKARGWHSLPGGKRASLLPRERLRVPGRVLRGWQRRSEP